MRKLFTGMVLAGSMLSTISLALANPKEAQKEQKPVFKTAIYVISSDLKTASAECGKLNGEAKDACVKKLIKMQPGAQKFRLKYWT